MTNTSSTQHWLRDGIKAAGTYALTPKYDETITAAISEAAIIFWTSFQQYEAYKQYCSKTVIHCCPAGKTATLLSRQGITPVVFPAIKTFTKWKELNTR
jgi:hypothetical protein